VSAGDVKSRRQTNDDLCVVVNDRNIVLGVIQGETWDANPTARVIDVMNSGPLTLRPNLDPKEAREILRDYDASSVIVTTSDGELLGAVRIAKNQPKADVAA
jgi:Mg/Co/Ni transporter MgtE